MLKMPPPVQISLGLILLTISIFFAAQLIGLTPNHDDNRIYARQQLAENIALQVTLAVKRGDQYLLKSILEETVKHSPIILSLGLRNNEGLITYESLNHQKYWKSQQAKLSTPTHIQLPILADGKRNASLEISLTELKSEDAGHFGISKSIWLIIFIAISGFICFWLYLRKVLKHLDPASLIPTRVRNALNILAEGVIILDKNFTIVLANDAISKKLKISEEQMTGRKIYELKWIQQKDYLNKKYPWLLAQETLKNQLNVKISTAIHEGQEILFSVNSVPIIDDNGKLQGTMTSFEDITEIEESRQKVKASLSKLIENKKVIEEKNRKLNYLAFRDPLTGCLNRRSLFAELDKHFKENEHSQDELSVVMLDIDYFKHVNDTYGHNIGDEVIRFVGHTAETFFGKSAHVARFGGEEFCVLLPNTPLQKAYELAEICRKNIELSSIEGVSITSSFGVTSTTNLATTGKSIIHQADIAMYSSKTSGRNKTSRWHPKLDKMEHPQAANS